MAEIHWTHLRDRLLETHVLEVRDRDVFPRWRDAGWLRRSKNGRDWLWYVESHAYPWERLRAVSLAEAKAWAEANWPLYDVLRRLGG